MAPKTKKTSTPKSLDAASKSRKVPFEKIPQAEPTPKPVVESTTPEGTLAEFQKSIQKPKKSACSGKLKGKKKVVVEEDEEEDLDEILAKEAEEEAQKEKEKEKEEVEPPVEVPEEVMEEAEEEAPEEEEEEGDDDDEEVAEEDEVEESVEDSRSEEEEEEELESPPYPTPPPPPPSPKKRKSSPAKKSPPPKRSHKITPKKVVVPVDKPAPSRPRRKNAEPASKPPTLIQVNQSLPSSWFENAEMAGKWVDEFKTRRICCSDFIDLKFLEALNLPCITLLKGTTAWSLLNLEAICYPRLTCLFYINLKAKHTEKGWTLESVVKGVRIKFNTFDFAEYLGLPEPSPPSPETPTKEQCVSMARAKYLLPEASNSTSKQLTHSSLTVEAKIIFNIIVRCLLPCINSGSLLTDGAMELLYLILNGHDLDLANTILASIAHTRKSRKGTPLPFANLLTRVFKAFKVDFSNEEQYNHTSRFDSKSFEKIGIAQTPQGTWGLASSSSKALPISPAIDERMENLELGLEEVRLDFKELHYEFLDKMGELTEMLMEMKELIKGGVRDDNA